MYAPDTDTLRGLFLNRGIVRSLIDAAKQNLKLFMPKCLF